MKSSCPWPTRPPMPGSRRGEARGRRRRPRRRESLSTERRARPARARRRAETGPRVAPDHQADQRRGIDPGERPIGGDRSVLQHGDVVAEVEHLVQPVRDVEDRDALGRASARTRSISVRDVAARRATRSARRGSGRAACGRAPWRSRPSAGGRAAASDRHVRRLVEAEPVADGPRLRPPGGRSR